jgi:hypothetical protein
MEPTRKRVPAVPERGPARLASSPARAAAASRAPAADGSSPLSVLGLQRGLGNQALLGLLGSRTSPLALNQPGDADEREADRTAGEALAQPASAGPRAGQGGGAGSGSRVAASPPVRSVLGSPGRPLDSASRDFLRPRFGHDFDGVRVHTGERAATLARSFEARAFTVGHDVVFGAGQYAPETPAGRHLLAHEVTHVTQQARGGLRVQRASLFGSLFTHPIQTLQRLFGEGSFSPEELHGYLETLATKKAIENDFDSDNKARAIVERWNQSDPLYNLDAGFKSDKAAIAAPDLKAILIQEMFVGYTGAADQKAINRILGHDPGQLDDLKAAYKRLYGKDLAAAIESEMDGEELAFALHLLRPPSAKQMEVADEESRVEQDMTRSGKQMQWKPSGPLSGTDFEQWASAPSEAAAPAIGATVVMNCWEVVLLMAYRTRAVSWDWIHALYRARPGKSDPSQVDPVDRVAWADYLVQKLSSGRQIDYAPKETPPRIPARGDIVFFGGAGHVALATGVTDGMGRTQVLSFWPPPDRLPTAGTLDQVKLTTIEELVIAMTFFKFAHDVTFADPPW